jgi:hypothetical protein
MKRYISPPSVADRTLFFPGSVSIFLFAFFFATVAGLLTQFVVLPYLLPSIHAGHGLLMGGDWIGFHADAAELADKISQQGWAAYELRPRGQAPIGISAIVYLVTGIHEPWVLVPLHALLFAAIVVGFFNIFRRFSGSRNAAAAALLLVFLPSSLMLYAQIHKDSWAIAGTVWIFAALIAYATIERIAPKQHAVLIMVTGGATALVWLVRAYLLQLLLAGLLVGIVFLIAWTVLTCRRRIFIRELSRFSGVAACLLIISVCASDIPTRTVAIINPNLAAVIEPPDVVGANRPVLHVPMVPFAFDRLLNDTQKRLLEAHDLDALVGTLDGRQRFVWDTWQRRVDDVITALTPRQEKIDALPPFIARRVEMIINLRRGAVQSGMAAGSAIDNSAKLRDMGEIIRYLPRAFQIALFAPFPNLWFSPGLSPGAGVMRTAAGFEMALSYTLYLGFVPLLWLSSAGNRKGIIFVVLIVTPILVLLAITIPNVGTLYRMRYGYFFLLTGFGLVGWGMLVEWLRARGGGACRGRPRRLNALRRSGCRCG